MSDDFQRLPADHVWREFLATLRGDLQAAESTLLGEAHGLVGSWQAPSSIPPLPQGFTEEVTELLELQTHVLRRLKELRSHTHRHLQYVRADVARELSRGSRFFDQPA